MQPRALRTLRNRCLLAFLYVSELLLRLFGKRAPYGVLKIEIRGDLAEEESEQRLLGILRRPADDYFGLVALLRWAREDERLSGVFLHCEEINASWARVQGLRRGIERLREAGKRVWVHLNSAGVQDYYLATAAEHISLAPAATLDVTGLASESLFFLDALEKIGVHADVVQMGRYKAAAEGFTRRDMSPEHREMMESLLDDLYGQLVDGVAQGRNLEPRVVRQHFDRGPFVAHEAQAAGLIDEVAYDDEVEKKLIEACENAPLIERRDYQRRRFREVQRQVFREDHGSFAVVHVTGTIKSGESIPGPEGAGAVGAASIAHALKEVRDRDDVRAIVLRVASPGGAGSASDLIWRDVLRTREKKPVVVSCGDVAASGGYYVALAGTPVLAEPGTITGSIGVIAGKANLRGLYEKIGVKKELVHRGKHAGIYSDYQPLGEEERARIVAEAECFYESFLDKVTNARGLSRAAAAAAAEGRVWTGRQAWTRGLIDELGGIEEALDTAKKLAGVPIAAPVALERFPKPRRLWKLSLDVNLPNHGFLPDLTTSLSSLRFLARERVWALMPFRLRFF
jgi:protease-4